jgi:hypothetical protein
MSSGVPDRPLPTIEVTPEMIDAGLEQLSFDIARDVVDGFIPRQEVVVAIFYAMQRAVPSKP